MNQNRSILTIFPGQGIQKPGFAEHLVQYSPALSNEWICKAENITGLEIGYSLTDKHYVVPSRAVYEQLSIFVSSCIAYRLLLESTKFTSKLRSDMAGHSLGEYAMLVSAQVLSFEDGVRAVYKRAELMSDLMASDNLGMAAILNISKNDLSKVLEQWKESVYIACENSDWQFVLSGKREDLKTIKNKIKNLSCAKYVPLNVSGAFHSKYQEKIVDPLISFLKKLNWMEPKNSTRLMFNYTGEVYNPSKHMIPELLAKNLSNTVKWANIMEIISRNDYDVCFEVGVSKVLSEMSHPYLKNKNCFNFLNKENINRAVINCDVIKCRDVSF